MRAGRPRPPDLPPPDHPAGPVATSPLTERPWFPLLLFGAVAVALFAVTRLTVAFLPFHPAPDHAFPDHRWFEGWARWDTGWYWEIARNGYHYLGPHQQSPVAFFPAYPALMRALGWVVGDVLMAGVLISFACGLGTAVLFHRWSVAALGPRVGRVALALLLLSPFSFYLFGVVYSDALFLAAVLGAFLLLEHDRPCLAGLVGAVATAARPVGVALVVGLALRALELRGLRRRGPGPFVGDGPPEARAGTGGSSPVRGLRPVDAGVLVSALGLVSYCALLWHRFGDPLAFMKVADAPGWSRELTAGTVLKLDFLRLFADPGVSAYHVGLGLQAVLTVAALAFVPTVARRLGWGYAAYALAVVALPFLTSKDFIGMGRYVLAAFPCFAAAGQVLVERPPWLTAAILAASGAMLALMTSLFVRWYFLS